MPNPNPRVMVNQCYAASVYYGDLVRISNYAAFEAFHGQLVSLMRSYFGENLLAVTVYEGAERIIFVFKKLEHARQVEHDWENVSAWLQDNDQARKATK